MKKVVIIIASVVIGLAAAVSIYNFIKSMPAGTRYEGAGCFLPEKSVKFFYDLTYMDKNNKRVCEQEIFDEFYRMVAGAKKIIVADIFLINPFQGPVAETQRPLFSEFISAMLKKKKENPEIKIYVITDPINIVYGGLASPELESLKAAGIEVAFTDLDKLRDSNYLYSGFWRLLFKWAGNSDKGGIVPNPLSNRKEGISIRSVLRVLNFKANHRKVLITDSGENLSALVMTGNISDASSAHVNFAVRVDGCAALQALESERGVAAFSGMAIPEFGTKPTENTGDVEVRYITESKIASAVEKALNEADDKTSIRISQFFFSDRSIVKSLIKAVNRGAKVRLILDPNKDAFGRVTNGNPNRPVAAELLKKTKGKIEIRWYDTHGEQMHGKMLLLENPAGYLMIQGSGNYTRRNIRDYNLEADTWLFCKRQTAYYTKAANLFETAWANNEGRNCTVDYAKYRNENPLYYIMYRLEEGSGWCTY